MVKDYNNEIQSTTPNTQLLRNARFNMAVQDTQYKSNLENMFSLSKDVEKTLSISNTYFNFDNVQALEDELRTFVGMNIDSEFDGAVASEIKHARELVTKYHNKLDQTKQFMSYVPSLHRLYESLDEKSA